MTEFDRQYLSILKDILNNGHIDYSRDNHQVQSLPGKTMQFNLEQGFPILTLRRIPLKVFIAEMIWYIMGSNDPDDFVNKYTKIWTGFMNETKSMKRAPAYGYRWRYHFGRDQLQGLIDHLEESPTSRHAVVITWDPSDDGLGKMGTPKYNIPCPYTFTVNIIGGKLHLHNIIRSQDMMLGNPHDVGGFALLAYLLAARLGVRPGILTTSISNAHIWDSQFEAAKELVGRNIAEHNHDEIKFEAQPDYFKRAEAGDETLVKDIFKQLKSQYNPLPKIEMKVVVGYDNK